MIWQLVKRDVTWRNALIGAAVGAAAGAFLPREGIGMFGFIVAMSWWTSQPYERATFFQAGLPVLARDLFRARILALSATVWLPITSAMVLALLTGKPAAAAANLVTIGAGLSVLMLVAQSWRVRQLGGASWVSTLATVMLWFASFPIAIFVPRAVALAAAAVLCPVLLWNIWRQLPLAFEVLPAALEPRAASDVNTAAPAFAWWPILRSIVPAGMLVFLPMLVFMPLGGQWMFVACMAFMPIVTSVTRTGWTLNLPVRRNAVLAVAVLPWLTLLLIGALASNWFPSKPPIHLKASESGQVTELRPPLEFWRTGKAPVITSPWGEAWQPQTDRLLGTEFYNPYSFGPANSVRFFDWQFRRATGAVYGRPIDYAAYQRQRLTVRPLFHQARLAILNLAACACWVMLLVNFALTALHWRFHRVFPEGSTLMGFLFLAQMACVVGIDMLPGTKHLPAAISVSLVNALLLRISALLPTGLAVVALAAAIPVALLWWAAVRLFRGIELPPQPAARGLGASM